MYLQKNSTHEGDREKASSLMSNLYLPKTRSFQENPLFNKLKGLEKNLNLHV